MKKIVCGLLTCILLVASLSGCGANKSEGDYTVTFEDGTESQYDGSQIQDLYKTDERKFQTIQKISGSGTIKNSYVTEKYLTKKNGVYTTEVKLHILVIELDGLTLKVTLNGAETENGYVEDYELYSADTHGVYASKFFNGDTITFSTGAQYGKSFINDAIYFHYDGRSLYYDAGSKEIGNLRMSDVIPATP